MNKFLPIIFKNIKFILISLLIGNLFSLSTNSAPKFMAVEGQFPWFTNGLLAAKAICMEEVGEIKQGKALWTFENVLLKNKPIARDYYFKYIKADKESYSEFVLYALDQVSMVYKNLSSEEKEKYNKLPWRKKKNYLPKDNCEKHLNADY